MAVDDENLYDRCPHCNAYAYTHAGRDCGSVLPSIQDILTWYSRGELTSAQMRRTYENGDLETWHLTVTRRVK